MLAIIVCSFTELLIEIREKLKSQQKTKRAKNLRKHANATILPTNAFKLQISAQKSTPLISGHFFLSDKQKKLKRQESCMCNKKAASSFILNIIVFC